MDNLHKIIKLKCLINEVSVVIGQMTELQIRTNLASSNDQYDCLDKIETEFNRYSCKMRELRKEYEEIC